MSGIIIMNNKNILIEITNEGSCISIWSDENPLLSLGDVEVTRLSDVEYDHEFKGWIVRFRNGVILPKVYKHRMKAISAEIDYVEEHIEEFAEWAKIHSPEKYSNNILQVYDYE